MKLQNAVVLVTGANRGLGLAFTKALLAAGAAKVYAAARDPASVTQAGVQAIRLDVTNTGEVAAAARDLGDVTLLVNNAGIARGSSFLAPGGIEAQRAELETNFFGPLATIRAFAPVLARNGGGAVINVRSALSWVSSPAFAHLLRFQVGGLVAVQWPAPGAARTRHATARAACRIHGHRHGPRRDGSESRPR